LVLRYSLEQFQAHGPKPVVLVPVLAALLAERAPQVECRALEAPLRQAVVQTVQQLIRPGRDTQGSASDGYSVACIGHCELWHE
jgi:hypothetical protein